MTPIKTAVLGVGLGGLTFHIPFVLALPHLFTLHAVLERNPASPGGKVHERFGEQTPKDLIVYRSYDDLLSDSEIELVIISTPSGTHFELAKGALEAGKHVLVDKPITALVSEARTLEELAKAKNVVLYPFQNARWHSDFLALKKLLDLPAGHPNSLGTLYELESRYDRHRTSLRGAWKHLALPGSGLTYDLAAHSIDQALVLFGRPLKITAHIENIRGLGAPEADDAFTIMLRYPPRKATSGIQPTSFTVILRAHLLSVRAQQVRYVARGTQGTYIKYGVDVQEQQLKTMSPASILQDDAYGREPETLWGTVDNARDDGSVIQSTWPSTERGNYAGLFENLAAAIREGVPQAVKWEESMEVIEMIELAFQSAKGERTVVVPPRTPV